MTCLFVNQLTVIDASYLDASAGIVGESWIVDVALSGDLNDQGMIFDFGLVKKQIKQAIDATFDHKLLVPAQSAEIVSDALNTRVKWHCKHGIVEYAGPHSGVNLINADQIDSGLISEQVESCLSKILPANIHSCRITLRHEQIEGAWYRYSHGLKKHDGACQRIAHGHRSRIEIFSGSQRVSMLESLWADRFENIYIGTRSDLSSEESIDNVDHLRFKYIAMDGPFELLVPKSCCYLIDTDTTVENIATHIHSVVCQEHPNFNDIIIKAYEGVQKGALSGL